MALALTPRLLRRGLELFAVISLIGVAVVLVVFGENLDAMVSALAHLRWAWLLVGVGLASMDWIGGGPPPWGVPPHVHPRVRWRGMGIAGGGRAGGAPLPPLSNGPGPPPIWGMRRAGGPLPHPRDPP